MHGVAYPLLRPLMRLVRFRIDRQLARLPFPLDSPHVHAPGVDPDRVLLFGSGPAVGYGVLSYDLALPGYLARQLSTITGRGVDLDIVADPEVTVEDSLSLLSSVNLWRYDAILLTIGANNALLLTSVAVWRAAIRDLLSHVDTHMPQSTRVFIVAVPPFRLIETFSRLSIWLADQHSVALNRETRRIVAGYPHMVFVPFSPLATADDIRYRSAATYEQWASLIVAPLSQHLGSEARDPDHAGRSIDEMERRSAVESLGIIGTGPEPRFDRITELAAQLLGTKYAAISFVHADSQWLKSAHNFTTNSAPRRGSFGDAAIQSTGVFVVEDARLDPRFRDLPYVQSESGVRFWAGYPIESPFGERIGVLSVFSPEPRSWTDSETELLRDLALQVQREIDDP